MTATAPGRVVGVDLGERRIGIAVSDSARSVATGLTVLYRSGQPDAPDHAADHAALAGCVADVGATAVVVGLPLSLSGEVGPAARRVLDEVEVLRAAFSSAGLLVDVETYDERFTTVTAAGALRASGRKSGSRRARSDRKVVDQVAAAVMLQSWLDRCPAR